MTQVPLVACLALLKSLEAAYDCDYPGSGWAGPGDS
jgi:hypothetical protein